MRRRITGFPSGSSIGRACRQRICAPPSLPSGSCTRISPRKSGRRKRLNFPSQTAGTRPSPAMIRGVSSPTSWPIREGHEGKIYTLHGPVEMNHTEIAAAMSEVLGAEDRICADVDRGVQGQNGKSLQVPSVPGAASGRSRPELSRRNLLGRRTMWSRGSPGRRRSRSSSSSLKTEPHSLSVGADNGDMRNVARAG